MDEYESYENSILSTPLRISKYDGIFQDPKIAILYFVRIVELTHGMAYVNGDRINAVNIICHEDDRKQIEYYRESLLLDESTVSITASDLCYIIDYHRSYRRK